MREFCLTEEVIQQFVDGELSEQKAQEAAAHLAACEMCASLLDEVEQQNAFLAEAFAPEMSLPVPTASLRQRLDASIADLSPRRSVAAESTASRARNWFSSLFGTFSFTPQQSLGFASLVVMVAFAGIFAAIYLRRADQSTPAVVGNKGPQARVEQSPERSAGDARVDQAATAGPVSATPAAANPAAMTPAVERANYTRPRRPGTLKQPGKKIDDAQSPGLTGTSSSGPRLLPGEESYLEAIASLTTVVEANKDDVLKPALRADYERNLAVADQAIATTRQQAKRNPNDRDAVEFMFTAYQNKIELLSAVADQTRVAAR